MKKYLLIALIISQLPTFGQPLIKENFINCDTVIKELKSTENIKSLGYKYEYVFILLRDSSNIELIKKTGYQYIRKFRNYARGLSLSNRTVGFVTDKNDIKEVFLDKISLKRILDCFNPHDSPDKVFTVLDYPIYIKDNMAIFETSGPTWSNTYFARLKDGVIQLNWLGGIIE